MSDLTLDCIALGQGRSVDLRSGIVSGPAGEIRLEARLAKLLSSLVAAGGAVVGRDTLIEQVWGGRPVGDDAIDSAICRLRLALGDHAKLFVQTAPKRGYRFASGAAGTRQRKIEDQCLRGQTALELWEPASVALALSSFQVALSEEPANARALAGASLARATLCVRGTPASMTELRKAEDEAHAAQSVSRGDGLSRLASGLIKFLAERDVEAALAAFKDAVAAMPSSTLPLVWRSQVALAAGDFDMALADADRAVELDPANASVRAKRVEALFVARRFEECSAAAGRDLHEAGVSRAILAYQGFALMVLGEGARAIDAMAASWRPAPGRHERLAELKQAFERGGAPSYFLTLAKLTNSEVADDIVRPIDRALLWAMANQTEPALAALRLAETRSDLRLRWLGVLPQLDALRASPEFQAMCARHAPRTHTV